MKIAIYIEDGTTQLVLTPENEWEKKVVNSIPLDSSDISLLRGSFYECAGGWVRQKKDDESLIIRTPIVSEEIEKKIPTPFS